MSPTSPLQESLDQESLDQKFAEEKKPASRLPETRKQRRERERAERRMNKKTAAVQNKLAKAIRNNDQKAAIEVRERLKELRK